MGRSRTCIHPRSCCRLGEQEGPSLWYNQKGTGANGCGRKGGLSARIDAPRLWPALTVRQHGVHACMSP